jgi:RHS repeat-associated protein
VANHWRIDTLTSITYSDSTPAKNFTYHFSGRCTGFMQGAISRTYSWDKEWRITAVSETGQTGASYGYNGFDARATRTFGGATTTFKRDGADPVDAVLSDVTGGTTARYLPGISEQRNGVSTYFHEGIKNAIAQTNASQTVTATKRYDAFGLQVASTGTWKSPFAYGGPWGYQEDGDAYGLKLLGHRYYDPSLGRFLSRDIAKSGRNWQNYCANSPVSCVDPQGLAYWLFDGKNLTLISDNGKRRRVVAVIPAVSGKPGSTGRDSNRRDYGPLPNGEYYLDPREIGRSSWLPFGNDYFPFWGDWENCRVALHPKRRTNTFGRSGFFIHGGTEMGSAGCIDVGPNDERVIDLVQVWGGGASMTVIVLLIPTSGVPGSPNHAVPWGGRHDADE